MAITIICGMPRNGKGIVAMELLEQYCEAGRPVYTNIQLLPGCPYYNKVALIDDPAGKFPVYRGSPATAGRKASKDYGAYWHYVLPGSVVIVDEADNYIDATEYALIGKDQRVFHKQHGKLDLDIFYICQNVQRMPSFIRQFCQRYILCEWNWRSMRMFQRLVPYFGLEYCRSWSRFLRAEFADYPFREANRIADVAVPYNQIHEKFFVNPWYSTKQLIGDTSQYSWSASPEMRAKYGLPGDSGGAKSIGLDDDDGRAGFARGGDAHFTEGQALGEGEEIPDYLLDRLRDSQGMSTLHAGFGLG